VSVFCQILKEIAFRRVNFLLATLALIFAVGMLVCSVTSGKASERETVRIMRDLGLNLRIIPKGTDMNRFWENGFSDLTMPQGYVETLAAARDFSSNHITATLITKISWHGSSALLTGIAPEICPPGKKKSPMGPVIAEGTLYLGSEVARRRSLDIGANVELLGRTFTISGIGSETGTRDDIRIQCGLADAQRVLGLSGRINEIRALECLCQTPEDETLGALRAALTSILPETEVVQLGAIAKARRVQRRMASEYFAELVLPVAVVVCCLWIAVLALLNVRERRLEIGILRALGHGGGRVATLVLGRALLIGLLGALLGFAAGTALALGLGPGIFRVTAAAIRPDYTLLAWSLLAAPGFAALASLVPAMIAVLQDPAVSLRQE